MTEYDPSEFHPRSLRCVFSLDSKQAQSVCVLYSLPGKTKVEQHLAIVDHFFETPTLKSEKNQKAQNDNEDKLNTLLEHAQKKIEAQIAQSQQIFEQVTNKFLDRITAAQQSAPIANHDNEVTKQLVKEVVEESGGRWVDVVKKMGKQMDNFVSQGEARERATRSCNARIIRFDETEGETTQQLLDQVNSQVLQGQMKLAIKAVAAVRQPISRRAETKPGTAHKRAVLVTFATAEDRKVVFQNRVILKGTHWGLEEDLTKQQQEQKRASWHLFEKAKADKMKAYWRGADLYINDTKVTAQH
jgi:hypothetical protein